jgi:hypothetical protein
MEIFQKLHPTFSALETEAFGRWQKADQAGRDRICQEVAKIEAKMMMDEIKKEVERRLKT